MNRRERRLYDKRLRQADAGPGRPVLGPDHGWSGIRPAIVLRCGGRGETRDERPLVVSQRERDRVGESTP